MNTLTEVLQQSVLDAIKKYSPVVQQDPWRQKYHLMPPVGFLNDPNGLCYFQDCYHVFYQWSPHHPKGGLKFWGHFISQDLVNWTDHGIALYPDSKYDCQGVYSGCALVEEDEMSLFYTGNVRMGKGDGIVSGREQNVLMVTSEDGLHFSEKQLLISASQYPQGLSCHVRDPKVWKEDGKYRMVLGARSSDSSGMILLYSSSDKRNWIFDGSITPSDALGYMWECPDVFCLDRSNFLLFCPQEISPLSEGGVQNRSGYILLPQAITDGAIDTSGFTVLDHGFDFYAPQTFEAKGKRILIGWMGLPDSPFENPTTSHGWQHCLTIPRELYVEDGQLLQAPAAELEKLRKSEFHHPFCSQVQISYELPVWEAKIEFSHPVHAFTINLREDVTIDYFSGMLTLCLGKSGFKRKERKMQIPVLKSIHLFSDCSSLEIFADGKSLSTRLYDSCRPGMLSVQCPDSEGRLSFYSLL